MEFRVQFLDRLAGTSIVWDDLFASDEEAYAEFERTERDSASTLSAPDQCQNG